MKNRLIILLLGLGFLAVCQKSANTPSEIRGTGDLVQLAGCARNALAKTSEEDSCFTYAFGENLVVDFCVTANCCPDSNRFLLNASIEENLIHVTVVDTADNLCRCICPYLIHAEFTDLSQDHYIFRVEYGEQFLFEKTLYR